MLALPETADGGLVPRVDQEVEAAEPLDRDDRAVAERRDGGEERVVAGGADLPCPVPQGELRAAIRAGVRLGVEAAVGGSSYSARQAAHIGKWRIEVRARS